MQKNKIPLNIFEGFHKYKLVGLNDTEEKETLPCMAYHAIWVKFKDGKYDSSRNIRNPKEGYTLGLDYDGHSFRFQTSEIIEIVKVCSDYIEFKSVNSHYKLCILNQ